MRFMKTVFTLFICLYSIVTSGQKVAQADSFWFAEIADKVNAAVNGDPRWADSLASIYFLKAKELNNDEYMGKGACLVHMSIALFDPGKAKMWYDTANLYLQRSKNYLWNGYLNMNQGNILTNKYSFESGINHLFKGIQYFELAKDSVQITYAYSSISRAFHDFGNYEKGKEYALKGLRIADRIIDAPYLKYYLLLVLGINYDDNKEYDQAIATHLKALKFATDNNSFLFSIYNNLGNTYKKKGDLHTANSYFQKGFALSKQLKDDYKFATIYGNLGDLAMKQENYQSAQKYLDSCLYYSEQSGSPEKLKDAYEYSSDLYEKTGDYKKSLHYLKEFLHLKDSLENIAKAGMIYDAQERYEAANKEKENHNLQVINRLRTIEKEKAVSEKKNVLISSVALIVVLGLLAYLWYRNKLGKIKRSENRALFIGEQNERIRIARDLHDSVGQMLSLVKMKVSAQEQSMENDAIQDLVDEAIFEVRNVSHNLIPEDLNFGLIPALETLAEKINGSGSTKMSVHVDESIRQLQFEQQNELSIYRIIQEVVNNTIRHSEAGSIELSLAQQTQKILLSIRDNGKGMDAGSIENAKGIGWKNIRARVNLLEGEMKVQSEKSAGTQIEIILPKNG